jgi:hypothetical protein
LKAIFRYNPFDASGGDDISVLVQSLGDDLRGHVRVEESIPYNLPHDLIGPAVVPFGTAFEAFQSLSAVLLKGVTYLVVALPGISELLCGFLRAKTFTVALIEHRKFTRDFIIFPDGKGALRAGKEPYAITHLDHGLSPPCQQTMLSACTLSGRG